MLDVNDFIAERGGNPEKIRESQRRRFANVEIVDEVIALFEDHRRSKLFVPSASTPSYLLMSFVIAQYSATQLNGKINDVQKQIATKKKVVYILLQP